MQVRTAPAQAGAFVFGTPYRTRRGEPRARAVELPGKSGDAAPAAQGDGARGDKNCHILPPSIRPLDAVPRKAGANACQFSIFAVTLHGTLRRALRHIASRPYDAQRN